MNRKALIKAAQEQEKPALVLKNGKIINVFTGEILEGDIAITDGIIVGVGSYSGKQEKDLGGKYAAPGFINAHVHVESSMVAPEVYALEEMKQGTTTIITDPHEIANVGGLTALREILAAARRTDINYYVMLPSCVPSTPFEHAGAVLDAKALTELRDDPLVLGLGELMNAFGTVSCDEGIMDKLDSFDGKIIDGHFPGGSGKLLNAYACAGVNTDHESISYEEAVEKLRAGIAVLVREGSASRNLDDIMQGIIRNGTDTSRLAFCTDDKHLADIRKEGTIRYNIRRSTELGLDPVKAVQIGTINAARIYGLEHIGAIACGYKADIVVFDDFEKMIISEVYKDGRPVSEMPEPEIGTYSYELISDINIASLSDDAFIIPERESYEVIGIIGHQIVTKKLTMSKNDLQNGLEAGEIRKIAVVERHHATGFHAAGYIKGYGLEHGAVASTVAHDSHNIVVIGDNDEDMLAAVAALQRIGGGYVIVRDGKTIGELPLVLGGLMSLKGADEFIPALDEIIRTAYSLGVNPEIDPFITLSFMALPVIPELRITDSGLFDVTKMDFVK